MGYVDSEGEGVKGSCESDTRDGRGRPWTSSPGLRLSFWVKRLGETLTTFFRYPALQRFKLDLH